MAYSRDPYWLTARFNSECHRCKGEIQKGDQAFYYPNGKRIFCENEECGRACSREFESARFSEQYGL